ncbi:lasso peptide biosynthesis PqqD family chaperone [Actinomadura oligospora]|uniref:lasso peptide biosynthesis PqqD family chaperone n=1 Tax=Actinomadura oligospora TaxID=111804 RepID=UPI001B80E059|nr:lasso peptide biosynthesis PqqD family chaperone [Actinomadura oligospora]
MASEISCARTDYGMVLLDEVKGRYWTLNPTGTLVLDSLLGEGRPADAVAALMQEFNAEENVMAADVHSVIDDLVSAGILVQAMTDGGTRTGG